MTIQKNCVLTLVILLYLFWNLITIKIIKLESMKDKELYQYLVILVITALFGVSVYLVYNNSELKNETFQNNKSKYSANDKIEAKKIVKLLQQTPITFIYSNSCPHSLKQMAYFDNLADLTNQKVNNFVTVHDLSKQNDTKIKFPKWNGAVPAFHCNGNVISGAHADNKSVKELLTKIKSEQKPQNQRVRFSEPYVKPQNQREKFQGVTPQSMKEKDIVLVTEPWCGHCKTLKSLVEKEGYTNSFEILNGKQAKEKYGVTATAFPAMFAKSNKADLKLGGVPSMKALYERFS